MGPHLSVLTGNPSFFFQKGKVILKLTHCRNSDGQDRIFPWIEPWESVDAHTWARSAPRTIQMGGRGKKSSLRRSIRTPAIQTEEQLSGATQGLALFVISSGGQEKYQSAVSLKYRQVEDLKRGWRREDSPLPP